MTKNRIFEVKFQRQSTLFTFENMTVEAGL